MAIVVTIGGVDRTSLVQPGWSISAVANGRDRLTCRVKSADGAVRPALDGEILVTESGTLIYGGAIETPAEAGWGGLGVTPIETTISAIDFNALADRRFVNAPIPAGTLKAALTQLVTDYLAPYGVTLDAAQVNGPTLTDLGYVWVPLKDVLDNLAMLSNYVWEIDYTKVLRAFAPGSLAAPFNVIDGDGHAIGDITVEASRSRSSSRYANSLRVIAGPPGALLYGLASDAGEIAAHTLWELVVWAPTVTTQAAADALAAALLAQHLPTPKLVRYDTEQTGAKPGQTQTITIAARNLTGTYLITDVQTRHMGGTRIVRTVTATEGLVFQGSWRDTYQQWAGSGGATTIAGGVTGGGSAGGLTRAQVASEAFAAR